MKVIFAIISLYLIFTLLKYCTSLISLLKNRFYTDLLFKKIDILFKKRYDYIEKIIPQDQSAELIQLKSLSDEPINMDRKIALNCLLENIIKEDTQPEYVQYKNLTGDIAILAKEYNKYAEKLKQNTEVYPASFLARLMNIKPVDFIKTTKI